MSPDSANLMFVRGFYPSRSASLAVTVFGAISNFAIAVQVIAAWRSLKWEPESEWEASGDSWQVDGVKVIWGLLSAYFASSAAVCVMGFMGIIKNKPALVRFYRDYSIADFSFCAFATVVTTYAVFHASARAAICEELSHHPELLRDLMEMGLNLENCERWLERAVLAFIALMFVVIVIRLHFILAVSNLYSQLTRHASLYTRSTSRFRHQDSNTLQRIYLLPPMGDEAQHADDVELVYAPVPISSIPKDLRESATEAWVSTNAPPSPKYECHARTRSESNRDGVSCEQQQQQHRPHRHRRHSHSHAQRRSRSSSTTPTGTIRLPILPDEGLLPPYRGIAKSKV
ncbi:hypothetical protein DXG03_000158 [Asterophora parasitica]|uniref:Uncharacterized protein n=1 Tax=Asterophora parasitica TaxID=117018 RepID=A0A9P7KGM9_9AGAR|nr:hypothetical protein DXG03_000158 [Asterophora parasitica]